MSKRFGVSKGRSSAQFKSNISRTKSPNMRQVMRGGWRL